MTMSSKSKKRSLFEPTIVKKALWDSVKKLNPAYQIKNPVMFVVEVGSILTALLYFHAVLTGKGEASPSFRFPSGSG
jgi:K+-transporting ATPase ATPase B chain